MSLGMGVIFRRLCGDPESEAAYKAALNKVIEHVSLDEDVLKFQFTDKTMLRIWDDGRSCCEQRSMRTDDDLAALHGATFLGAKLKQGPDEEYEYGAHEVQFLEIETDKGSCVFANHNIHNGYYGGFYLACSNQNPDHDDDDA